MIVADDKKNMIIETNINIKKEDSRSYFCVYFFFVILKVFSRMI